MPNDVGLIISFQFHTLFFTNAAAKFRVWLGPAAGGGSRLAGSAMYISYPLAKGMRVWSDGLSFDMIPVLVKKALCWTRLAVTSSESSVNFFATTPRTSSTPRFSSIGPVYLQLRATCAVALNLILIQSEEAQCSSMRSFLELEPASIFQQAKFGNALASIYLNLGSSIKLKKRRNPLTKTRFHAKDPTSSTQ